MTNDKIRVYVIDVKRPRMLLQWVDPITGKRKSRKSQFADRRNATKEAGQLEQELNSKAPSGDGSLPWDVFVEKYEEDHLSSLAYGSQQRALGVLSVFEEFASPKTLRSVNGAVLSSYISHLRKNGRSESTIMAHIRTLRAAFQWAQTATYINHLPAMPVIARSKRSRSKGRPLTFSEFVKMLRATKSVVGPKMARSYRRLMIGLWRSGLRLSEALALSWLSLAHGTHIWVDMTGQYPLLGIVAEAEKGFEDRLLPIVPDFGRWLMKISEDKRTGFVFPIVKHRFRDSRNLRWTSKVISLIGKKAGIQVNANGKYASAHDLRRSFGLMWSAKTYPAELQQLMRHTSIQTTMEYYAIRSATEFAAKLWSAESAGHTTDHATTENRPNSSKSKKNGKPHK